MRTNVFDRTWEIKLRPINSLAGLFVVGNDTNANRVDSIIPDARITEQFGLIGRNLDALLTDTWRPVTAPPAATRRVATDCRSITRSRARPFSIIRDGSGAHRTPCP